jgi:hypothetical protein
MYGKTCDCHDGCLGDESASVLRSSVLSTISACTYQCIRLNNPALEQRYVCLFGQKTPRLESSRDEPSVGHWSKDWCRCILFCLSKWQSFLAGKPLFLLRRALLVRRSVLCDPPQLYICSYFAFLLTLRILGISSCCPASSAIEWRKSPVQVDADSVLSEFASPQIRNAGV